MQNIETRTQERFLVIVLDFREYTQQMGYGTQKIFILEKLWKE